MTGKSAQERARKLLDGMANVGVPSLDLGKPARGILGRLEQLTGAPLTVREIDPGRVRVWSLQGRLQSALDTQTAADLIDSIGRHGQTTPAIVRPVRGDADADYEVIDGSRRRFACATLGQQLKAIVADLSDRDAALLTETADASRKHSAYETGLKWRAWLQVRLFDTQDALAQWLQVSPGDLSFKLSLAELPYAFVVALGGHERLSRELGRRLARFIGRTRSLGRLDEIRSRLEDVGTQAQRNEWTGARALVAYSEIEAEIFPARKLSKTAAVQTVADADGRPLATLASADRSNLQVKLARPLSAEERAGLMSSMGRFLQEWAGNLSLAAKDAPKPLKKKEK